MFSEFAGHISLGAVTYFVYLILRYHNRAIGTSKRKESNFPEIPGWPILGQIPEIIMNFSRPLELGMARHLKFRPGWSVTMPGLRLIDISKPEWLEYVQKTNFHNYVKGPRFHSVMADVFGNGIFVTDGAQWKKSRHLLAPLFTIKTFKVCISPALRTNLDTLHESMQLASESRPVIDICDVLFKFSMNFLVYATLGKDMGQLDQLHLPSIQPSSPSADSKFVDAFEHAQKQLDLRFALLTSWKVVEKVNVSMGRKIASACQTLHDYASLLIDERLTSLGQGPQEYDETPTDLLGFFIKNRKEMGGDLDQAELKETFLNLIIAGRDSTAEALTWAFYHLLMNKDIVNKIREEASEVTGKDRSGQVTYENSKEFKWAHAVILEALRLHPSIPKNVRFALKADKIPGGPVIEAGDAVRWSDWAMARDPQVWGDDCLEFRPARWIDDNGNIKQFGHFKFHAFNGGPRVCLGMNFAILQCICMIVEVFHNFELELEPEWLAQVPKTPIVGHTSPNAYGTPKYKPSLTLPMAQSMMVTIKPH
ncbi:hypothetical protein KEM48_010989 [Puccinia striiformis f. sp. tritici PST-130]|uniref:Cytochrome P450 n=1 Tax=Puccinia striiformis f. sp. tritici PST-78 TaxID=1165861 RepID=A0A0L0V5C4_9BASI|nr:hypothetical protein Pst134EB_026551 [Puccinia striiformis f. sp. tritici]KAI9629248.1 hypothetical protein KEM48_011096 [Puccinia striiformis f. sp. tritici PST-130]KAI9629284.1 hypothetical protein KEM48_010989 [Puccinia striiformis f. sp. tritici PST-130]KNE94485.1 hypothetical protein PSTG_12132 [Puccinia striiformis f. sp. tritici PST-78]